MLTALKPQDEQLGIANEGFGSFDEEVNKPTVQIILMFVGLFI